MSKHDSKAIYGQWEKESKEFNRQKLELQKEIKAAKAEAENFRLQSHYSEQQTAELQVQLLQDSLNDLEGRWADRGRQLLESEAAIRDEVANELREKVDQYDQEILDCFNRAWSLIVKRNETNLELSTFWNRCNSSIKRFSLPGLKLNETPYRLPWGPELPAGTSPNRSALLEYARHYVAQASNDPSYVMSFELFKKK